MSVDDKTPLFSKAKFDSAVEYIYKNGGYKPTMFDEKPLKDLVNEIAGVLTDAYDSAIATSSIPPVMDMYLRNDLLTFSGFKSHAQLQEISQLMRSSDGKIKPFSQFSQDVIKVHTDYNINYLNAEYNFAVSSAQMAAKWVEVEADGDRYNLQYRTADDARVREAHRPLHNVTLPPSDPFWDKYYPPNGWGCRCTTVQVRKSKYEISDSEKALADGLASTRQFSNGIDKGAIFRFNPGKLRKIMPPKHPYLPKCTTCNFKVQLATKQDPSSLYCIACQYNSHACFKASEKYIKEWSRKNIDEQKGLIIKSNSIESGELLIRRGSIKGVLGHSKNISVISSVMNIDKNIDHWEYLGWKDCSFDKSTGKRKHPDTRCFTYYKFKIGGVYKYASVKVSNKYDGELLYCFRDKPQADINKGEYPKK